MNYLDLPERTSQPRSYGITAIHDVKLTAGELKLILEEHHSMLDIAKLGVGSAYVTPKLREKIELFQSFNVRVYFGGTLFEKFFHQGKIAEYQKFMRDVGIDTVEVSTGTIDITLEDRMQVIKGFLDEGFKVLSEVGTKDSAEIMAPSLWIHEIGSLLEIGCEYVITEGRNSGTAGVYRANGELRTGLLDDIATNFDYKKLIFEAPMPKAQMFFINKLGANVNLGNINPGDLLLLEAQRQGLRSETFFLKSD